MKSTGIVRNIDELGRVVIPQEVRNMMKMERQSLVEFFTEDDRVIIQKYQKDDTCMVTGEISDENMKLADGHIVLSQKGAEMLLEELKKHIQGVAS